MVTLASFGASEVCPTVAPPVKVNINATAGDINLNNSRSSYSLKGEDVDTTVLSLHQGSYEVSGLTKGNIETKQELVFNTRTDSRTGRHCVWLDAINVNIHLDHVVYVAREHKPGTCMFRETYNHEIKHVNVDRNTINKYLPVIRATIKKVASTVGVFEVGNATELTVMKKRMNEKISSTVASLLDNMQAYRRQQQNAVDTIEEYTRVSEACKARY